jgi:hypothetical protein
MVQYFAKHEFKECEIVISNWEGIADDILKPTTAKTHYVPTPCKISINKDNF